MQGGIFWGKGKKKFSIWWNIYLQPELRLRASSRAAGRWREAEPGKAQFWPLQLSGDCGVPKLGALSVVLCSQQAGSCLVMVWQRLDSFVASSLLNQGECRAESPLACTDRWYLSQLIYTYFILLWGFVSIKTSV